MIGEEVVDRVDVDAARIVVDFDALGKRPSHSRILAGLAGEEPPSRAAAAGRP
jgi:hypothetical protein